MPRPQQTPHGGHTFAIFQFQRESVMRPVAIANASKQPNPIATKIQKIGQISAIL